MFQLADRIVTDARHEADLMIDEDERRVLGSQGFVGANLIGHGILLSSSISDFRKEEARRCAGARRSLLLIESHLRKFGACKANFLSGGGLRLRRSLFNKICDRSWLRYVDRVASLDLNDRSTRALGHGTLGVRWNHPVLGGEQVPARLRPPRGFADRAANGADAPRNLGISHERGFFWVHVGCERSRKLRPVEEQKAVLRRQYRRYGRAGRRVLNKRSHRLALVWSEGSDVYEG